MCFLTFLNKYMKYTSYHNFFVCLLQTTNLQMVVWLNEQLVKAAHRKGSNRWMDKCREYCLVHNVGASQIKKTIPTVS